jgi:ankyrin repeat protein
MEGWTVFHEAAARDNILAVEYIIKLMNDSAIPFLNMPDERGVTPLALAKKRRAINVTNYLEGRGIDWNQRQVGDTKYPVRTQHFENHTITSVVCISLVFFLGIFYVFDI